MYDYDGNSWILAQDSEVTVGITSLLAGIAGKLSKVKLKPVGTRVSRGMSLGVLESLRMVGPLPSPLSGVITATNSLVVSNPSVVNDSPYSSGWMVHLTPTSLEIEQHELMKLSIAEPLLKRRIVDFHVRCFKLFPDIEMSEIGVECRAVLAHLNDIMKTEPLKTVVHVVSDDPTAYVEMVAWSDRTGQELVEWRNEGQLYHFIVRKQKEASHG